MNRLTMTSDKGGLAFTFDLDITCEKREIEKIVKLGEKLKHYEDLAEKGLLVELPCKVGDTVYAIVNKKIVEDVVDRIEINNLCKKISTVKHSWLCNFDNVFPTQSEAEQALKEI